MCNRFKKLVVTFLTIFIAGSVFLPSISFAQTGPTATTTQPVNPTNQVLTQTGSGFTESLPNLPICSVIGEGEGTFEGCFVRLFYYAILYPSAWIASIAGQVFDYFVAYTLNSESYHSGGFIESGWRIVRDIVNASFIFILLYVAIRFIVNAKDASVVRIVTRVIIIAIVINFSLFMTRAIIDAGNILARVFYEKIVVENDIGAETTHYTTLSAGLIGKVNPQKLLSADTFRIRHEATGIDSSIQQNTLGTLNNVDNEALGNGFQVGAGFMILIILLASAVNIALAWVFFSVSLSLVGRTLGLWIMMIMSPVAFASWSIPFLKIKDYGFEDWLNRTIKLSFMAVLFMFFLYLTIMFLDVANSTILNIAFESENMSTVHLIMAVIVPCVAVLYLLKIAQNQAKSMSGEFGSMVGTVLKRGTMAALGVGGFALGTAAGVGAVAGRQVLGRAGAGLARNANTSTAVGRAQRRLGNRMSRATYDARNVTIPQPVTRTLRSGLSYATGGAVGAGDLRLTQMNTLTGRPDSRGYTQRREDRVRRRVDGARELLANEQTQLSVQQIIRNPNGTVTSVPRRVSVEDAQRDYNRQRAEIERRENYADYVSNRDTARQNVTQAQQDFATAERENRVQSTTATIAALTAAQANLVAERTNRDQAQAEIQRIESMWREQRDFANTVQQQLAQQQRDFYQNYSQSIRDWNPTGVTGRGEANREAADRIEDQSFPNRGR